MTEAEDDLINTVANLRPGPACSTCKNERLNKIIIRWLDRIKDGENLPTLYAMHNQLFHTMTDVKVLAIRRHIISCLRRDPVHG